MAAKKGSGKSKAVTNYDEELAKLAGKSATLTDSGGGGRFFSTRGGQLMFDDAALPGNQMAVIVIAWCLENVYYEDAYDPDNRTPPTCFAFCKDPDAKDEMSPPDIVDEEDVFERQSDLCKTCDMNQFGSARTGRGKACQNRRRLALLPAGTYASAGRGGGFDLELIEDEDHFRTADEAYLKVPVMSGKGFDAYVKDVADQFSKPLFAVYTRVYLTPDAKSQFRVNFELIEPVADDMIPALLERYRKVNEEVDFPYTPFEDDDEEEQPKKAAKSKKLTKGRKKK